MSRYFEFRHFLMARALYDFECILSGVPECSQNAVNSVSEPSDFFLGENAPGLPRKCISRQLPARFSDSIIYRFDFVFPMYFLCIFYIGMALYFLASVYIGDVLLVFLVFTFYLFIYQYTLISSSHKLCMHACMVIHRAINIEKLPCRYTVHLFTVEYWLLQPSPRVSC